MTTVLRTWGLQWLLCLLLLIAGPLQAAPLPVWIVLSERTGAYKEAADAFVAEMNRGNSATIEIHLTTPGEMVDASRAAGGLMFALGTEACRWVMPVSGSVPVLCTLVPQAGFESLLTVQGRHVGPTLSALYLNQPPGRQLDLIRLALPKSRRVGILVRGDGAPGGRPTGLEAAAQARGLHISSGEIGPGESLYEALKRVLDDSDVLLAQADPVVYNANTLQNILLTSFRVQVPMIAFSPAYTRAGALLSLFSTPPELGTQAAQMARAALGGQGLPPPQFPAQFEINFNERVGRSLGLDIDVNALAERLRRLERNP